MPFCPACGYEYEEGITACPDCGAKLVAQQPIEAYSDEEFVLAFSAEGDIEAEIVMGLLEEAGVPVIERPGGPTEVYPVSIGPLSEEGLYVPISKLDEAKRIIADAIEKGKQLPEETE